MTSPTTKEFAAVFVVDQDSKIRLGSLVNPKDFLRTKAKMEIKAKMTRRGDLTCFDLKKYQEVLHLKNSSRGAFQKVIPHGR
mmetsp:Transcript_23165/g.41760  ORF Transcript_23165/g.41760 Transcript_23165/m.41760 type:complete len:82 (-) Transcript_23165:595-840(-)